MKSGIEDESRVHGGAAEPRPSLNVGAVEFRPTFSNVSNNHARIDDLADEISGLDIKNTESNSVEWKGEDTGVHWDLIEESWDFNYQTSPLNNESDVNYALQKDSLVAILGEQFPTYNEKVLSNLLDQCNWDINATLDWLFHLEKEFDVQYNSMQYSKATNAHAVGQRATNAPSISSKEDFPSLGSKDTIPKTEDTEHDHHQGHQASAETGSGTANDFPRDTSGPLPYGGSYALKAREAAHLPTETSNKATSMAPKNKAAPIWESGGQIAHFTTGTAAAAQYAEMRATARDLARMRNACFQQATNAFMSGNKALAKQLSAKGREYNNMMHEAHEQASNELFAKRNRRGSIACGRDNVPTIDLHGLHVAEASRILQETLSRYRLQNVRTIRIVVGVGKHGKVPARLPEAIKKMLSESHLVSSWREAYAGLLEAYLK